MSQNTAPDETPPAPVLAFIYDRQTSPTRGVLVIRLEICRLWARDSGWAVAGEWVEQGNGALYDDERPRFDAMTETMREAVNAGWQPVCLVADWYRLSRDRDGAGPPGPGPHRWRVHRHGRRGRRPRGFTAGRCGRAGGPVTAPKGVRTVCGASLYLPSFLVVRALAMETSAARPAEPEDVQRYLRCTLEHSPGTDHYALVLELDGPDFWQLLVLPDCPGENGQPCNEFQGHDGGHTAEVYDPWADVSESLSK